MTQEIEAAEESTAVALVDETSALDVLGDPEKFDAFFARVKAETDKLTPDTSTPKGRQEIKSMAFKVKKTRTFIDAERKKLIEPAQSIVDKANKAGKLIRDKLLEHEVEVRAPLTAWEAAEEKREKDVADGLAWLRNQAVVLAEETSTQIGERAETLKAFVVDPEVFQDAVMIADSLKTLALDALREAWTRQNKAEKDAIRLAELEAANEAREERERVEREEREAKEKADREALEKAEKEKADLEAAEAERAAAATKAADEAKKAAEQAAQVERDRLAAQHEAELAAEKKRANDAEAARKAEADKVAAEKAESDRQAEAKRKADEARQADRDHRSAIMREAKASLMVVISSQPDDATPEQIAVACIRAVANKEIPHMEVVF